jgi:hypothetical protein
MGGYGSGRKAGKVLTSKMTELDVRFLHRQGYLRPRIPLPLQLQWGIVKEIGSGHDRFRVHQFFLNYSFEESDGVSHPVEMSIKLDWTPCYFGGYRPWFLCPRCQRRVAILYGGKYFYCRICHNLAYPSENEQEAYRILRQANKIRRRIKCEPGALNPMLFKPMGMHQKTFDRLRFKVQMLENKALKLLYYKLHPNQKVKFAFDT